MSLRISVVIACYNRPKLLERLLSQLAKQDLPATDFEVIAVDDGSVPPIAPQIDQGALPFSFTIVAQANGGAAAARNTGAFRAQAPVILFIDDDMQVPPGILTAHLREHDAREDAVVLGRIVLDEAVDKPLFERFHGDVLIRFMESVASGKTRIAGSNVWTGNLSVRRAQFVRVGAFDTSLKRSEDAEFGMRLEKDGAHFVVSNEGYSLHGTDHTSLENWLDRAFKYGIHDLRIGRKHRDLPHANPFRYFESLNPVMLPFLLGAVLAPKFGERIGRGVIAAALRLDKSGYAKPALRGATLAYGIQYARGLRQESGSALGTLLGYGDYVRARGPKGAADRVLAAATTAIEGAQADFSVITHYADKYGSGKDDSSSFAGRVTRKVGLQIMTGYRLMRFFHDAQVPLLPELTSRTIRLLYGSDIHWKAQFAPGVLIVHGFGLAVSHGAVVDSQVILFHNVTLGEGRDPHTGEVGAPHVAAGAHIGAGATIFGPVTIGEGSKVMANCVVTESVPAHSVVVAPRPTVRAKGQGDADRKDSTD